MSFSTSEASIATGRAAYANGQNKLAIENFTLVAHSCPCNHGKNGRRTRCNCKDFAKVARDGGDIYREAMHTCSCDAQKFAKCHEPSHVQALDYRIHVFEKMNLHDKAKRDAEWLLEIAPRALEGYLRLGKAYRLANEPDVAYAIWTAGIEVGGREGYGGSAKLNQLHRARAPLQRRFARKDPLQLPIELVDRIFSLLTTRELSRCQCVSKAWKGFLERNSHLWADLELDSDRMPSPSWFKELGRMTQGSVESLRLHERSKNAMQLKRWTALYMSTPRLRHLTLRLYDLGSFISLIASGSYWFGLKSLNLGYSTLNLTQHNGPQIVTSLLQRNKESLEELFLSLPGESFDLLLDAPDACFPLNRLRILHTNMGRAASGTVEEMRRLAQRTPRLEQLNASRTHANFAKKIDSEYQTPGAEVLQLWPHLRAIRQLVATPHPGVMTEVGQLVLPVAGLRSFESFPYEGHVGPGLMLSEYCRFIQERPQSEAEAQALQYPTLERFWAEDMVVDPYLKPCLAQSLASGALTVFGARVEDFIPRFRGSPYNEFMGSITWMAGEPSIETLGLFGLALDGYGSVDWARRRDRVAAVIDFVDSFPNLNTVVLSKDNGTDLAPFALVAERVISSERIKTIYLDGCPGAVRDKFCSLAKEKDVTIGFDYKHLRPKWPLDLGPVADRA